MNGDYAMSENLPIPVTVSAVPVLADPASAGLLEEIAVCIRAIEKVTVKNAIVIGQSLRTAHDLIRVNVKAEHTHARCFNQGGNDNRPNRVVKRTWTQWLEDNFAWTDRTARRYISLANLSDQKNVLVDIEKINISMTALYAIASMFDGNPKANTAEREGALAALQEARSSRVTTRRMQAIVAPFMIERNAEITAKAKATAAEHPERTEAGQRARDDANRRHYLESHADLKAATRSGEALQMIEQIRRDGKNVKISDNKMRELFNTIARLEASLRDDVETWQVATSQLKPEALRAIIDKLELCYQTRGRSRFEEPDVDAEDVDEPRTQSKTIGPKLRVVAGGKLGKFPAKKLRGKAA
jgi:hypothetical protein